MNKPTIFYHFHLYWLSEITVYRLYLEKKLILANFGNVPQFPG